MSAGTLASLTKTLRALTPKQIVQLIVLAAAVLVALYLVFPGWASAEGVAGDVWRNVIAFVSLTGMGVVTYVAWPSKWNLPAHLQLAFAVPAYAIPLLILGQLGDHDLAVATLYVRLLAVGFVGMTLGVCVGGWIVDKWYARSAPRVIVPLVERMAKTAPQRVVYVVVGAVFVLVCCFAVMGFIPAFASDPSAAKFFKDEYHAPYQLVSVPYRLATTIVPLFLPLVGVYAWSRRKQIRWVLVLVAGTAVMLLSLLREPAISGLLVAVGILVAYYRRFFVGYLVMLIIFYVAGSAVYVVLALLGVEVYQGITSSGQAFWSAIASGAPDVMDQMHLLGAWLPESPLTWGRTFVGGLVPGNFEWNPSVWTLMTLNPAGSIEEIPSGGFRLPAPLWGFVSFSWAGAIIVPLVAGVLAGALARIAAVTTPRLTLEAAAVAMIIYLAVIDVIPMFYQLSYLSVVSLVTVVVVLGFWVPARWRRTRRAESLPPAN